MELRWEIGRGRAVRVARGTYVAGSAPKQTMSRIRHRVATLERRAAGGR